MEILLNLIGRLFKPDEETAGDEESLQAALSAQVRKHTYENRGMSAQDRKGPKKNSDTRSLKQSVSDLAKLMQAVFNMKAETGCMRKAMVNAGISFEKSPNVQKPRERFVNGRQKNKFTGTAKKNKSSEIDQRSLAPIKYRTEASDSDDDPQPEYGAMTIVVKPKKRHVSPRLMNPMLVGIARRNSEFQRTWTWTVS